jgi:peptidoglycan/LPS O-acetylase OafA/YrhL
MSINRITSLDGLRGIAALSVVLFHINHSGYNIFNSGYFAVDLFFEMSGYVLALNYANAVGDISSVKRFYRNRAWRLLPLHVVGCLLGIVMLVFQTKAGNILNGDYLSLGVLLKNLLLLPDFGHRSIIIGGALVNDALFPVNDPAWSLHFELLISLIFPVLIFLHARNASARYTIIIVFLVTFVSYCLWLKQISPGSESGNYYGGILRALSEFSIGVGIYYIRKRRRELSNYYIGFIYIVVMCTFSIPHVRFLIPIAWFICIFLIYPLAIYSLSCFVIKPDSKFDKVMRVLGDLSYPVYILHFPIYVIFELLGLSTTNAEKIMYAFVMILMFSWLIGRTIDVAICKYKSSLTSR